MNKLEVSIVIPNYNGSELLQKNLPYLIEAQKNKKNKILEIIVVDDASTDSSLKVLKEMFGGIKVIKHKNNRGFSSAVNSGARSAKGNLIALLNTDITPEKNFLVSAIEHFSDDKVFAVGLHEGGFGASRGYFSNGVIQLGQYKEDNVVKPTFYVSGGGGVFRKQYWSDLGGMDERLLSPFYWEDIDLCYRAWKRGYVCLWEPKADIVHESGSTVKKLPKKFTDSIKERNQLLMIWKDINSLNLIKKHLLSIFVRSVRHPGYLKIIAKSLVRLPIVLRLREKEGRESVLSDEAVFEKFHE